MAAPSMAILDLFMAPRLDWEIGWKEWSVGPIVNHVFPPNAFPFPTHFGAIWKIGSHAMIAWGVESEDHDLDWGARSATAAPRSLYLRYSALCCNSDAEYSMCQPFQSFAAL